MRILVATNNPSKLKRVRKLLSDADVEFLSPSDLGVPVIETDEGSDIAENAEKKARAYLGKTNIPILGMDSAFVIPGEDFDPAKVRRNALAGRDEATMTREEIAQAMTSFYGSIAERHGGTVAAYWEDALALVRPDGSVKHDAGKRPVTLTSKPHGTIDSHLPIRSMYIVAATGKYSADQTPEEELLEMKPYQDALKRILGR